MVISHNQKRYKTSGWIITAGEKPHNGRSKLISSHLLDNFSWWELFVRAFLTNHASNGALRKAFTQSITFDSILQKLTRVVNLL